MIHSVTNTIIYSCSSFGYLPVARSSMTIIQKLNTSISSHSLPRIFSLYMHGCLMLYLCNLYETLARINNLGISLQAPQLLYSREMF